jgi:hypothetical protein
MVKQMTDKGSIWHEPPYTKAEEEEFYLRNASGPVALYRGTAISVPNGVKQSQQNAHQQRSRARRRPAV